MDTTKMQGLVNDFNATADAVKEHLTEMLQVVTDGRVPKKENVNILSYEIDKLSVKYDGIYAIAEAVLSGDELPAADNPVKEYITAIENSKLMAFKKQLEDAKTVLSVFVEVKSHVDKYIKALEPLQNDAEKMLESLKSVCGDIPQELIAVVSAQKVFIDALSIDDMDSAEGEAAIDRLRESGFGNELVRQGLIFKKYYLSNTDITYTSEKSTAAVQACASSAEEPCCAAPHDAETTSSEAAEENTSEPSDKAESQENSEATVTLSSFKKALQDNGAIISETMDFGTLSHDVGTRLDKPCGASKFKSEMNSGDLIAEKVILRELSQNSYAGFKHLEMIANFISDGKLDKKRVENALNYLVSHSYVGKYELSDGGAFYYITSRLVRALGNITARSFIRIDKCPQGVDFIDCSAIQAATVVTHTRLHDLCLESLIAQGFYTHTATVSAGTNFFILQMCPDDMTDKKELFLGSFWNNLDECDDFKENMPDVNRDITQYHHIFFASANAQYAKNFANAVLSEQNIDASKTDCYLYSFFDDAFFTYDSMEEIDKDALKDLLQFNQRTIRAFLL